jgi:hypothetical protein
MSALSTLVGSWLVLNAALVVALMLRHDEPRRLENPIDNRS